MNIKKYIREELDGTHWPDADTGDDLYYGVDFNYYLNEITQGNPVPILQTENLITVTWELPNGLVSLDSFVENNIGVIRIKSDFIGIYKTICTMYSETFGKDQYQVVPMLLTVY